VKVITKEILTPENIKRKLQPTRVKSMGKESEIGLTEWNKKPTSCMYIQEEIMESEFNLYS
jgi:hypothetical protein